MNPVFASDASSLTSAEFTLQVEFVGCVGKLQGAVGVGDVDVVVQVAVGVNGLREVRVAVPDAVDDELVEVLSALEFLLNGRASGGRRRCCVPFAVAFPTC